MAPQRSLIPSEDNTSTSFQTAANVVGVIPPKIHDILTNTSDALTTSKIDDNTSGLSYLINNTNSNVISVWEHSTQTLNEELIPPTRGICVTLIHPEHDTTNNNNNNKLLVTCLGPNNNTSNNNNRRGEGNNNSLRHLYAASSTSGVLSVWVLDNTTKNNTTTNDVAVECDASVRLALKDNEVLTSLTSMNNNNNGGNSDTWLLASTNYGRLYKIYKTSRPLTLSAKLIKKKLIASDLGNGGQQVDVEEEETGLVRGLYNYFTTPSKKKVESSYGDDEVMDDEGPGSPYNSSSFDDENIVALVTLPTTTSSDGSGSIGTAETSNKSPPRTPAHSPQKQRRISSTSSTNSSSSARAVSVSSSLVLKEWKISLLAGPDSSSEGGGKNKEGYMTRTQLFPRHENGTLDLSSLSQDLEGYTHIKVLASPQLAKDGNSLLMIIRLSKENDIDATRAYIVRIGLSSNGDSGRSRSPHIIDSAWLDRYSGQSLDVLDCVGLVTAEEDVGDNVGGAVVYVAFGQVGGDASGERQVCPVTISAVHFSSSEETPPRIKDIDLYQNVVPSAIHNSMSYDPLTGGCVLLSTSGLLCGVHVRFPTLSSAQEGVTTTTESLLDEESLSILAKDETVQTVKSHLQSSFRQYLTKLKEGNSGSNPARAVVPPSIGTCPSHVLTAAVVLASKEFACASSSSSSASTGVFSPRVTTSTPVTILRDKLQLHKDFITFLLHAGAYRRVSSVGRIRLRDHGELITASRALLIACQNYFSKAESAAAGNSTRQDEIAKERRVVMKALEKTSEDVTALPRRWAALQQLSTLTFVNSGDFLLFTSSSICQGVGQALGYRQHESSSMYDITISDPSSQTALPSPWTSSTETLDVLITQLQAIEESGEAVLSNSVDYDTEKNNMRRYVEDMSASALSGYRDVVTRDADNKAVLRAYDQAKRLTIPLLRKYANDDGDDLVALSTSLDHSFFEGIVQICHDHRQSWRFQGPYSDKEADERYDLRLMMSNSSTTDSESYAHLHSSRDYQTDQSFCTFVLKWYADRGLYPEVFELGKSCPHDLTRYVRNDDRLSNLSWVQQLRVGGHEQATLGLMSVNTPVLFGDKEGPMSLWEKDQMMSLAKLSNKLALAKNPNAEVNARSLQIENSLTLISAQKILQEDTAHGDEVVLKEDDLLRLAVEKIQSSRDVDEIKRFGICGLAIASAKLPTQTEAMANDASYIWQSVIKSDIHTWESTANENSMAVGGISEEELIRRVEGTAFVEVMYDFVSTSEGKMQSVSYTDTSVRNNVSHALGSDALSKVLALSADIVVAANLE